MRDPRELPKAHLHLHLEGSARPSTVRELASRHGVRLPVSPKGRFESFAEFGMALSAATEALARPEDLARVCRELVEDEAKEGVVYTEPMISPHLHAGRFGLSPEDVFLTIRRAFEEASGATGVSVGMMVGIDRSRTTGEAEEAARFAALHAGYGVVSLGLAGAGTDGHEEHARFARACEIARSAGLAVVPHAGLLEGADSVGEALELLSPTRIAHGVRTAEDPKVLEELALRRIPCDVCPTAEAGLGVFEDVSHLPFEATLGAGVPVTLGADDPLLFGSSAAGEYALCRGSLGLSDEGLALVARYSVEASALPAESKRRHTRGIDRWLHATPL
jgi:adenosine deaminase